MMKYLLFISLLLFSAFAKSEATPSTLSAAVPQAAPSTVPDAPFLDVFPNLKPYLHREPDSGFYLGFGASPVGVLSDRYMFTLDFFRLQYIKNHLDWEILNASYGFTQAQTPAYESRNFTFRTAPKFRITEMLSVGPLVGYEFVSFPNVNAILYKSPYVTPDEPFSSEGPIYGGMVSQIFHYREGYYIQINELAYQQNYSTKESLHNWIYRYDNPDIQNDPTLISSSLIYMIDFTFLF